MSNGHGVKGMAQKIDPGYLTLGNEEKMHNTPMEVHELLPA